MSATALDITGTRAYKAVTIRRVIFGWPMMLITTIFILVLGSVGMMTGSYDPLLASVLLLAFGMHVLHRFCAERLENEQLPAVGPSVASFLSIGMIRALYAKGGISGGDLLSGAIASKRGRFMLDELGISPEQMMNTCWREVDEHIDVAEFLLDARDRLEQFHETRIGGNVILFLLFSHVECCTQLLRKADMSIDDLRGLMRWESFHHHFRVSESSWTPGAIRRNASLGRSWVMGYTDALDFLTSDVNTAAHVTGEKSVVIHREAIDNVMRVFSRARQRNVLLMGKVGVGKQTLVENIAITLRSIERARHEQFTRVLMLHTERLLSGVSAPDSFLLSALSRAQKSGHFILVIRDLAVLLRTGNANLRAVIMKCLEADNMTIVGIVDSQDYHSLIKTDPVLDNRFEKVQVEDATDDETMSVLMAHYFALEKRHVRITYKALKTILDFSKRYLSAGGGFPGKAIDVMDDAILHATEHGHAYVNEGHVRDVISLKGRVNVKKIDSSEKENLIKLEDTLKQHIVGQDAAVRSVTSALKRARMDLSERKRPIGTFLFLGPTGVGKTQTAKVLAQEYFGSADAMIRLDMNEYSHADSVFSITGGAEGGDGFLAQRVQDKPFSLILLDEIEKAHPSVLNLFLQILDEGFLTDSRGVRTDFRNTIIIATSNAGALFIRDFVREHKEFDKNRFKEALIETILRDKLFAPEFINRFDEIVLYYPLTPEMARHIATLMIGDIIGDIEKRRGISVSVEEDVIGGLVERGYSLEFGAREMRRTITEMIEDYLADYMLHHDVARGEEIIVRKGDLKW